MRSIPSVGYSCTSCVHSHALWLGRAHAMHMYLPLVVSVLSAPMVTGDDEFDWHEWIVLSPCIVVHASVPGKPHTAVAMTCC